MEIPGRRNFEFIEDKESRLMLQSAFNAINGITGGWEELLKDPGSGGFIFSKHDNDKMSELKSAVIKADPSHSGTSYAWTMRNMQGIARLGWNQYKQLMINMERSDSDRPASSIASIPINTQLVSTPFDEKRCVCAICFEKLNHTTLAINNGKNINPVECGHMYHKDCILEWINLGNKTCPMCRGKLLVFLQLKTFLNRQTA